MSSEYLYLANRALIDQVIDGVCRRQRLSPQDAEDFAGAVRLHLINDDYAVLRKFEKRSSFQTYLITVVTHRFQDWRNARWGKWRPSAAARRQGPLAVHLERLIVRDGLSFEQAHETLRTNFQVQESRQELETIFARLPNRHRRQLVNEDELVSHAATESAADGSVRAREAAAAARLASQALTAALDALPPQDRIILQMRFQDGLSIVDIALALMLDQKPLYRRVERLLAQLRGAVERSGVTAAAAAEILGERGFDGLGAGDTRSLDMERGTRREGSAGPARASLVSLCAALAACTLPLTAGSASSTYLFAHFTGNGETGLHFASSTDGLEWTPVAGGRSFLTPAVGSRLMRDPSIARGSDGRFHMVWTTGWWDKGIGLAHSDDLITWSDQRFLPVMAHEPDAQNCWAPEIFFDEDRARFLIFWATSIPGRFPDTDPQDPALEPGDRANHRMYYVETKDFTSFSEAKLLYDGGFSVIDAIVIRASSDRYVMILKDETLRPTPKKHLRVTEATRPEGPYGPASAPISIDWVEGPSAVRIGDDWVVYYDEYTRKQYGAIRSRDLRRWTPVPGVRFPAGTRHGTALAVPSAVAVRLAAGPDSK